MKHRILILVSLVLSLGLNAQTNSTNGYKHTPQGPLHILIVFAEKSGDNFTMDDWPLNEVPAWAYEMFETEVENIGDNNNLSKYYYDLSQFTANPLQVTAFIYPELISVLAKDNAAVFDAIESADPDFSWEDFDNRSNFPNWLSDNSNTLPDQVIDYAVIIWRDNTTGDGGESTNDGTVQSNDTPPIIYSISDGHKHNFTSGNLMSNTSLFTHEFSHEIFNAPHYLGANNVTGENYYTYYGWGTLCHSNGPFKAANAWEMWWMGWLPGVTSVPAEPVNNGVYSIGDLYTENDALRIEIPNSGGHYLWIENHQLEDSFLDNRWEKDGAIYIPALNQGLYMYITKRGNSQSLIDLAPYSNNKANHIKVLHGEGNWDYSYISDQFLTGWGVQSVFAREQSNVIAGENDFTSLRGDYNIDLGLNLIYVNEEWNSGTPNEIKKIGLEWIDGIVTETYNFLGTPGSEFSLNDEISLSGIFPALNYPSHDLATNILEPFLLNGLKVNIIGYNIATGVYDISIEFDDWEVRSNKRWCGNITLPENETLVVVNDVELTLNKSSVPVRSDKDPLHGYSNPTNLIIKNGSSITLQTNAVLIIDDYSELILESGAELILESNAILRAKNYGKIILHPGAIIKATHSNAKIIIDNTGTLVMNDNNIQLNSTSAKIELHSGGTIQTAPNVDFTFTGAGYLHYEAGGIFNLGSNSRLVLQGTGTTDMKAWLQDDADLYIYDRDVYLEDCKIVYNNNSKLRTAFAELYAKNVLFNDGGTHADNGIHVYDTDSFEVMQCTFDGFDIPILIENIDMCPEDIVNVQIRQSTLKNYDTWGIDAHTVDRMYLYANSIEGNASATAGMFLYDVIECHIEAGVIKNHTAANGVMLNNTRYFILDGATIRNNSKGIESYNSSIYLRNLATIKNNTNEGIHAFSSVDGIANPSSLRKIVVGDEGCGWIINNGTGIAGEDIALHIDAMEHAIANDGPVYPNRFDGNTDAIDICYDYFDDTYISETLMARYNYWTGGSAPINVSLGFNAGCNDIAEETSGYLTTAPSSCTCAGANCEEEMDEAALTLRMNDNSCAYLINQQGGGRISVAAQFNDAYQLFMAQDYNFAYQKFKWLKNQVEAEYTNGLPDGSCKLLYGISYWMVDDMALIAEAHCQPPFYDERYAAATATADIFSLFPNPATEQVTLASTLLHEVQYSIYTLDGRFIESGRFTGSKVCGIAHYTPGLYLVQLQADGQQQTIKWVVE